MSNEQYSQLQTIIKEQETTLAKYNATCDYGEVCSLPLAGWQYTNTGRIDGWNDDLDMNEWYK